MLCYKTVIVFKDQILSSLGGGYLYKTDIKCLPREWQGGSFQFSSVQDDSYALRKAHMRSTLSLGSFLNVAFETVPMFV